MKDKEAQLIWEALQKVDEADDLNARHWDDPNPPSGTPLTTAEVLGQVHKEIDEYMTTAVFTVGGEDLKWNVLAIVKQYMEGPIIDYK